MKDTNRKYRTESIIKTYQKLNRSKVNRVNFEVKTIAKKSRNKRWNKENARKLNLLLH